MHVNVPVALPFAGGAPFPKQQGGLRETSWACQKCVDGPGCVLISILLLVSEKGCGRRHMRKVAAF